jgi:hypothetical protein
MNIVTEERDDFSSFSPLIGTFKQLLLPILTTCKYYNVSLCMFMIGKGHSLFKGQVNYVRFQVLTAASMIFRIVFWDVLPCKMIIIPDNGGSTHL